MANDDEVDDETSLDPTSAVPGPRRSTYTPPPANGEPYTVHDDDELANALAADLDRIASGPINVIPPTPVAEPTPTPAPLPTPQPEPRPTPERPQFTPPPPPSTPPSGTADPAPWSSLPAPDPSQAVPLPEGPPQRPVRRSLADDDLLNWVDEAGREPGGTLNVIEHLESQLRLREEEAREFRDWESSMLALGTPDAIEAVEQARPEFTGVLPSVPAPPGLETPPAPETGSFILPEAPMAEWPAPSFDDEPVTDAAAPDTAPSASEPDTQADAAALADAPPPSLPAWDIAPPSSTWAPGPDYGLEGEVGPEPVGAELQPDSFDELLADSRPVYDLDTPVEEEPVEEEPVVEESVVEESAVEPVFEEPVFEEPVIEPEVAEPDTADIEVAAESESEPDPEIVLEAEPDTDDAPAAPFAPPPLIEPPPFGGPPILPSQAATQPPIDTPVDDEAPPPDETVDESTHDDLEEIVVEAADEPSDAISEETTERPPFDFTGSGSVTTPATPSRAFSFDDLLSGPVDEDPPLHPDPEPETAAEATPEALFIEPLPVAAGEPVPTDTGSVTVIDQAYEEELDDDVDETDRAFPGLISGPVSVDTAGIAVVASPLSPPSGPIATVRVPEDEVVLIDNEPIRQRVFSLEDSGLEPTPVEYRVGRAARLFWLWFAANSSILSLGLGAAIFAVGMSLRQSIVAVLAGVALSFIPLGLTTLAGKRSGQPTMVVSRATFGLIGNVVPAILALVTRLFWGAVLLWLLASSVAIVLVGAQLSGPLGDRQLLLISLAVAFLIALVVAFAGYALFARIQLILSVVSGILVVGLIAMTAQYINIETALTTPDGPWVLTVTGAVLVFSFVGLVWANSGADLARYQRPGTSGASSMLWATFGTTLPSFLLIGYGALLAASNEGIASGFLLSPLDTLTLMLPSWYPIPLIAATALSLLSGIIITLYSGGFALQSIGVRVPRQWSIVIVAVLLGGLALLLTFGVAGGINELFRDVATTLAVPTAAWAGIFAAETMIRNRRFESQSLLTRGGVYPDVRWTNLVALIVISAIGFALTSATVTWLSWQGYGFTLLGQPLNGDLAGTDLGVLVALVLGLLTPIVTGIPAIRRQESTVV